ncbi:putative clathrin assembly protein At1g25240 [Corylus avellana]|uniref:putative clathrin assembly protein At1g25240 n=1 Tax=Corylus avellana TaxID=13451 RepID=UPI001E20F735|nr:putative clathrin assembly protein At1g25240 [Corylus avellana]
MRLWKRAAGALKDRNSIWLASISRRTPYRNPDLEALVIKATSHDESYVDYKNAQRVFQWVRTSAIYLKPLIRALSMRMEKTRSWVVALKGLMLMHGVFHCKTPAVQMIGRLPFDLSNFSDGHSKMGKTWGYDVFIRAYFLFLDQKSALLGSEMKLQKGRIWLTEEPFTEELTRLQKWQSLLDVLLQIKPRTEDMIVTLVLEAMDCVVVEIFEVYSRICSGIAQALLQVYEVGGKDEAEMALVVLQKARVQSEELAMFFEFCRDIGVINASEFPNVEQIPDEDFRDLEQIINGEFKGKSLDGNGMPPEDMRAIVLKESGAIVEQRESKSVLKTIITEKWEVFEEDLKVNGAGNSSGIRSITAREDPYTTPLTGFPLVLASNQVVPDLISF